MSSNGSRSGLKLDYCIDWDPKACLYLDAAGDWQVFRFFFRDKFGEENAISCDGPLVNST